MKHLALRFLAILIVLTVSQPLPADDSAASNRNPLVRVATISLDRTSAAAGKPRLEVAIQRLNQAAAFEPDIVCLPEVFTRGAAETIPGLTTDRVAAWAREHRCWVICPLLARDQQRVFNSAVLINREGELVGRYDKIHPTENELTNNVTPGATEPPVFDTDFGRIGIQICFDVNWHQQWRQLKAAGAQIIFFPSAYPAARQVRAHAWLQQCYVVSSTLTRSSTIYDISGDPICSTGQHSQWAGAVLPLGKRMFEIDFHVGKMRAIQHKYGQKVELQWFHDDDLVSLASLDSQLTLEDLIHEFELTPHTAYIRRAENAQDQRRSELSPVPASGS